MAPLHRLRQMSEDGIRIHEIECAVWMWEAGFEPVHLEGGERQVRPAPLDEVRVVVGADQSPARAGHANGASRARNRIRSRAPRIQRTGVGHPLAATSALDALRDAGAAADETLVDTGAVEDTGDQTGSSRAGGTAARRLRGTRAAARPAQQVPGHRRRRIPPRSELLERQGQAPPSPRARGTRLPRHAAIERRQRRIPQQPARDRQLRPARTTRVNGLVARPPTRCWQVLPPQLAYGRVASQDLGAPS